MIIDPEFKALIPPLAPEELAQLEANILADGCRDPLVTWRGILIDGHNRFAICSKHRLEFQSVEKEFEDHCKAKVSHSFLSLRRTCFVSAGIGPTNG